MTVSDAVAATPFALARSVTTVLRFTRVVRTVKLALLAPTGITTLAGTLATPGALLLKATVTPAVPETVTVACVLLPPLTRDATRLSDCGVGGGALALAVITSGADVALAPRLSVTVNCAV